MLTINTWRGRVEIGHNKPFAQVCAILAMAEEKAGHPVEPVHDGWMQIGKEMLRGADRLNEYALTRMNRDNAKVHNMVSLALAKLGILEPRIKALEILGAATPADAHFGGWYFVDDVLVWKFYPYCSLCGELWDEEHICSIEFLESEVARLSALRPSGSVIYYPETATDYYLDWCYDQLKRAKSRKGLVGCDRPYCAYPPYSEDAPCVGTGICTEDER